MGGDGNSTGDQVILATGGYDHTIRFWQAHSGICQRTVQHPDSQVNAMDITPDRQLLAAAEYVFIVCTYDVGGGNRQVVSEVIREEVLVSVRIIIKGLGYQHIRMYDINSNNPNPVVNYDGISKNVTSVGFQDEGRWMFTGSEDFSARIWDLRSRNLQCQRIFQANHPVNTVCLHPNQGELYIGDQSGVIHVWDLRNDQNEQMVTDPDVSVQYIHIDTDGNQLAAIDNKGTCYLYRLVPGGEDSPTRPIRRIKLSAHKRYGLKCKFSPDSTLLATSSADKTTRIWCTADLQTTTDLKEGSLESPNGTSNGVMVRGWKVLDTPTPMVELKDPNQRWVWDMAFTSDSSYIITASSDNSARLWNITTGNVEREYSGHQKALTALAFKDGANL